MIQRPSLQQMPLRPQTCAPKALWARGKKYCVLICFSLFGCSVNLGDMVDFHSYRTLSESAEKTLESMVLALDTEEYAGQRIGWEKVKSLEEMRRPKTLSGRESFKEILSRLGCEHYYVFKESSIPQDRFNNMTPRTHAFAKGYSEKDLKQKGNHIYALPYRCYSGGLTSPMKVDFFLFAERGNKVYFIDSTCDDQSYFRSHFTKADTHPRPRWR